MDGGLMDKEIFAAIVRGDKPEPLAAIEPFHLPGLLASSRSSIFGHRRDGTKKKTFTEEPPRSTQFFAFHKTQLNPFVTTTVLSLRVSRNHNSVWESGTTPCGGQASKPEGDRELTAGRRRGRKTGKPQIA
jgi:hypothetical protein